MGDVIKTAPAQAGAVFLSRRCHPPNYQTRYGNWIAAASRAARNDAGHVDWRGIAGASRCTVGGGLGGLLLRFSLHGPGKVLQELSQGLDEVVVALFLEPLDVPSQFPGELGI